MLKKDDKKKENGSLYFKINSSDLDNLITFKYYKVEVDNKFFDVTICLEKSGVPGKVGDKNCLEAQRHLNN